ncbi:hypothetical protein U27_05040 [Candidatus Vecturithrix granuli]|uniref:DUF58 domain-containing protein n=1 Tax=Vecturithrix granuli TaxID=1499967 RepID=A0A081C0G2_VECG1|nr:hypothetical protein U27_05040 [Candidatus Vecturithrix granuli]
MKRSLFISILVYIILLAGLATLDGHLLSLGIPLLLYLVSGSVFRPQSLDLQISRTISDESVTPDSPVTITLRVLNNSGYLEEVFIQDVLPSELTLIRGNSQCFTSLAPGETIVMEYAVRGKRGSFEFGAVQVYASDSFDLVHQQKSFSVPARLLILPEVRKLGRFAIRPMRTRFYAGQNLSRQSGSGTDFFGVRMYQPGDPLRTVNWRISARHPRWIFANEYESERIADVGLILDARKRNDVQTDQDSLFNHAIQATASLAEAFLSDSNRVGLLIYGGTLARTFPGYGKIQRERILRALAQSQTGDHQVFKALSYLPTRFFPAKSQLVLISPLCPEDLPVLQHLRAFGYHLMVLSPDPIAFEYAKLPAGPEIEQAVRIAYLERKLLLRKLRRMGILAVDWQVDTPLEQTVLASLKRLPHWLRTTETAL